MKIFLISLLSISTAFQQTLLKGRVLNEEAKAIASALIYNTRDSFTYSDENGYFEIHLKTNKLKVSSVAYISKRIQLGINQKEITIRLKEKIENLDEVLVYGKNESLPERKYLNNTDDIMQKSAGVHAIPRANFASEFSIRGLNPEESALVIDGMKMFSACVDHMDPINNYVELENLEKIEINKGTNNLEHAQHIGASINLVTRKAEFAQALSLEAQSAYESVSRLQRNRFILAISDSTWAFRGTFSNKNSEDYYAGNNTKIEQSSFKKVNFMLDTKYRLNRKNILSLSYIGDEAKDIGYPKLLMDARKTKSHILHLKHQYKTENSELESSLYYTEVNHWMDDYSRDVTQRSVMANMYMPMFGISKTKGVILNYKAYSDRHDYAINLDYYSLSAFADMFMEPLNGAVPNSYLLNLADARNENLSLNIHSDFYLSETFSLKSAFRTDFSQRDALNEFGRDLLTSNWKKNELKVDYWTQSLSFGLKYLASSRESYLLSISRNQRMPNHHENYGYFLYNPIDDYFYYGSPKLNPETAYQINLNYSYFNQSLSTNVALYTNHIQDYIYGVQFDKESKMYQNLSSVQIYGIEYQLLYELKDNLSLELNSEYSYGENNEFKEALLMIAPFSSHLTLNYDWKDFFFATEVHYEASQNRIANKSSDEDRTTAFYTMNLRTQYKVNEAFNVKFGIENVFDRFYHSHLSVNNLAAKGRNFYLSLSYLYK